MHTQTGSAVDVPAGTDYTETLVVEAPDDAAGVPMIALDIRLPTPDGGASAPAACRVAITISLVPGAV